ncbi:MAG: transporter suffix domain-containing protein [Legionellaceae bacterium]|nr:transporter suffix domain-containing protein [Legionellaceae bacterium]
MKQGHDVLKYRLGVVCIVLSFVSPLVALIIPWFNLAVETKATLVTVFLVGIPEVFLLLGAALAGKEATQALTAKVRAYFGKQKKVSPSPISRLRYRVGLSLFFGGMLLNWILSYVGPEFIPKVGINYYWLTMFLIDVITILGFFVAGAPFWEKIKKLFIWQEEPND